MAEARERLAAARVSLDARLHSSAVGLAYFAMLYAARAALSEEDAYAKTHKGVWHLFHDTFVSAGRFDHDLLAAAQEAQRLREGADYEALSPEPARAEATVDAAERFVAAITELLAS